MERYSIQIGDTVTTEIAVDLCRELELTDLATRIQEHSTHFKDWVFDGISVLNDTFAARLTSVDQGKLTFLCALPHDLRYAYGESGNKLERKEADLQFKEDLLHKAGMKHFWATIFYLMVRIGGSEYLSLSFSWAFARKKTAM